MGGGDGGDHGDLRAGKARQRLDIAGVVHADLDNGEIGGRGHARQGQRHAPMVVVAGFGGVDIALSGQGDPGHFLGRGLADRAGDGDDLALHAGAAGAAQRLKRGQNVRDDQQGRVIGDTLGNAADQRGAGALFQRLGHEIMAVPRRLQRDEQIARLDGAGVDGNPPHRKVARHPPAGGGSSILRGPKRHILPSSAATATDACSASSKG